MYEQYNIMVSVCPSHVRQFYSKSHYEGVYICAIFIVIH